MGSKTDYLEHAVLNFFLANNSDGYTSPATVYVGLFTSATGEGGTGTEVTGGSYARVSVPFTVTVSSATNSGLVTFPTASADWGTITDFAIFDALTSGNMMYYGTLGTSRTVLNGDVVKFNPGQLVVTED
jgi:hypothetical protein